MADYLDMLRGFTQFTDELYQKMYQAGKSVQLPDEIDLYNFFEQWGGRAFCVFRNFQFTPVGPRYDYDCQSLHRYHSIKFKDRGTFLVSEKRYNELKAKKE